MDFSRYTSAGNVRLMIPSCSLPRMRKPGLFILPDSPLSIPLFLLRFQVSLLAHRYPLISFSLALFWFAPAFLPLPLPILVGSPPFSGLWSSFLCQLFTVALQVLLLTEDARILFLPATRKIFPARFLAALVIFHLRWF